MGHDNINDRYLVVILFFKEQIMQSFFKPPLSESKEEIKFSPPKPGMHYLSYDYQKEFLDVWPFIPSEDRNKYCLLIQQNPQEQNNHSLIRFLIEQRELIRKFPEKNRSWNIEAVINAFNKKINKFKSALDTTFYAADIPMEIFDKEFKPNTVYFNKKNIAKGLGYVAAGLITCGETCSDAAEQFDSAVEYGYAGKINIPREWIKGQIDRKYNQDYSNLFLESKHYKPQPIDKFRKVYFCTLSPSRGSIDLWHSI